MSSNLTKDIAIVTSGDTSSINGYLGDITTSGTLGYNTTNWKDNYLESETAAETLLKFVYPFISGLSSVPGRPRAVITIIEENNHIIGYRPSVVLLANIEEQLNRLTWE